MIVKRRIFPKVGLGVVIEAIALATSLGLFALNHGREPLEPPFNLIGRLLQIPGLFVGNAFYWITVWHNGILIFPITFVVQTLIWAVVVFAVVSWREKRKRNNLANRVRDGV